MTQLIPLMIVLPLFAAFFLPITRLLKFERHCGRITTFVIFIVFIMSIILTLRVYNMGEIYYYMGDWAPPLGIELIADSLGVFGALTISLVSFFIMLYSLGEISAELKKDTLLWYHILFLLLFASLIGISFSNDLFNLYVFFEITSIAACGIISVKQYRDCLEASFKYLMLSTLGSGLILLAIALVYMITGHLNITYAGIGLASVGDVYPKIILVSLALFTVGLSVKSALFPLHVWLPDAHSSAPTPSSAILSALVVKVYIISLIKILYNMYGSFLVSVIPILSLIRILAAAAILLGSLFAIAQDDIKRMLAYSTVAQVGYIFLGISLLTLRGMTGGILHIFNHAVMKSLLFLSAGTIIYKCNIRKISDLKGIGFKMPIVMGSFTVGAMAMVGLPGFNGFISKLYLALGSLDSGKPFYIAVVLISSLLNAIYYFPIVIGGFFGDKEHPELQHDNIPTALSFTLVVLSLLVLITGIYPSPFLAIAEQASNYYLNFTNGGL